MKSNLKEYDYIIVGSGLYGSVFAHEAKAQGKHCLVLEKRDHIGGNCHTRQIDGINVHWYGPHIFHTCDEGVWNYMNRFCKFNNFVNSPIANFKGQLYNLPFNMNTFCKLWPDVKTPEQARQRIASQQEELASIVQPSNLYEQGIKLVGRDLFEILVKGYSEKQWGMPAEKIPAFVLKRLPLRYTFDNNYYNDLYQGIPIGGYDSIFHKLLEGIEVRLNTDFLNAPDYWRSQTERILFTGPIDAYFGYRLGHLKYRSLCFEHKIIDAIDNYQGNAVINYTDDETPYTRTIEHKHFEFGHQPDTVISYEYPQTWTPDKEPYYPINTPDNDSLAEQYKALAASLSDVSFGGRLGQYIYCDMDKTVRAALSHPWLTPINNQ